MKRFAVAAPIPRAAPVTTASLDSLIVAISPAAISYRNRLSVGGDRRIGALGNADRVERIKRVYRRGPLFMDRTPKRAHAGLYRDTLPTHLVETGPTDRSSLGVLVAT